MEASDFGARLALVLRALGLSQAGAAAQLEVDKSLVGRWAAGTVRPSDQVFARLTGLAAARIPGFTAADWKRDIEGFAALVGAEPRAAPAPAPAPMPAPARPPTRDGAEPGMALPLAFLDAARGETERKRAGYEGFWRTIRPSVIMQGKVLHDHGLIRAAPNGLLEVRMGGAGLSFSGWAFLSEGGLFAILNDAVGCTPLFLIFRAVTLPKAMTLDGILLLSSLDAGRTPAAVPILLERIGDLSGDRDADDRRCDELAATAEPDEVPEWVVKHLFRDVGPEAAAAGGALFLAVPAAGSLSRGASPSGELEG